ncbi:MAG: type II secretion system protein GspG [Acidobacteriota bacterium]
MKLLQQPRRYDKPDFLAWKKKPDDIIIKLVEFRMFRRNLFKKLSPILLFLLLLFLISSCHKEEEKYAQILVKTLGKGKVMSTKNTMDMISFFLGRYMADTGRYPEGEGLDSIELLLVPGYVQQIDRLDAWGNELNYSSDGRSFKLFSAGDDGMLDTEDDIVMVDGVYR